MSAAAAVRPPLLAPGSVPSWRVATARAVAVAAAVVAFGVLVQWPLASSRPWLFASNLVVSGGFAAGSVLLSDEPRHARTRWALLVASLLWSVAWIQGWNSGPLPFVASLMGPAPATVAIWGLLQFPRPWGNPYAARAVLALIVVMQLVSFATTFTEPHPSGRWWPRVSAPGPHAGLLTVYNVGGVVCTIVLIGLFAVRVARLRGHELRITVPIGVAVVAGGLATALSDTVAAAGDHGPSLWVFFAWEDLLLVCVPASFILSYVLRRVCIEELSGRIDAYDTLPQASAKLQRALRDPTLQILLPGASPGQWVDADGRRQPSPAEDTARLLVPVLDEHRNRVAVVSVHPSLGRFGDLLTATAQSLVLVLDNARLVAQLRDELSLVEQSRERVERAVAAERLQIRHRTGAGPLTLTDAARGHLDSAVVALTTAAEPVPDTLVAARATITHAADDIRLLSNGDKPVGLGNGLAEAIPRVLEVHPGVRVDVTELRADPEVERVAYFVVTAAVGNAVKYAGRDAAISVSVANADGPEGDVGFLAVEVRDDGPGSADPDGHGLALMAERVASVGGDLRITSPEGGGTVIRAVLPRGPWLRFHEEALAFQLDDAAFGFYLAADFVGGLEIGDVDGVGAVVLQFAAVDVLVEQDGLGGEDVEHALVDGVLGQQAVHVDRTDLAHPVAAGDGLVLDGGLPLRFGEDHHGGGLDVQAYSPGLDLAHQDRGPTAVPEVVDHGLALDRRGAAGQRAEGDGAESGGDGVEDVAEVGEDDDFTTVGGGFLDDLYEAVQLGGGGGGAGRDGQAGRSGDLRRI